MTDPQTAPAPHAIKDMAQRWRNESEAHWRSQLKGEKYYDGIADGRGACAAELEAALIRLSGQEPKDDSIEKLRSACARLKLAERGTDNGWIDEEAVNAARQEVVRRAVKFMKAYDFESVTGGSAPAPQEKL
jgi:hypothetical protein